MLNFLSSQKKWIVLFGIWIVHGLLAMWQFAGGQSFSSVLSIRYLLVGSLLFLWLIFNVILIISVFQNNELWLKILAWLKKTYLLDAFLIATILIVLVRIGLALIRGLLSVELIQAYGGYLDRLSPVLNLMTFVSFEVVVLILFYRIKSALMDKEISRQFFLKFFIVLTVLGLAALIISVTGLGIMTNYKGDWARGLPAVPLLEWQILLVCLFCIVAVFAEVRLKFSKFPKLDIWIGIFIWLITLLLWLSQPVMPSPSALKPHEPNFEVYPFIDSQTYDIFSQSVLVGNGFGDLKIPQRPLYIVFLTLIHVLVGQDYSNVIAVQSMFFAFFPVLLYFFGKEFFGRPIGISIAFLAILRDYISNDVAPFTGNLSYSKVYLSEIPTAIFLVLFLLLSIRWIKAGFPAFSGVMLGGILGIAMLIRTQVVVVVPLVILFSLLVQPRGLVPLLKSTLLMFMVITLVVSPWLWRNWRLTGTVIFDSPESQTANLALRYSRLNGVEPDIRPFSGESNADYSDRLKKMAYDAVVANPRGALLGVANSFLNHGINNILLFPLRNDLISPGELLIPTNAFWQRWEGEPNLPQKLLLIFYTLLFGFGVSVAWHRNGWLGLLPLCLNLAYNLWTSLALLSGQRFMLAMDWSIYLYYMIGLFTLLGGVMFALKSGQFVIGRWYELNKFSMSQVAPERGWRYYILACFLFFGVGASLPLSEMIFPERYPIVSQYQLFVRLTNSSFSGQSDVNQACLRELYQVGEFRLLEGRAMYPRYYAAGDGESFTDAVGYKIIDEGRLVFDVVGQMNGRVIFPISQVPEFIPNASDVLMAFNKEGLIWFLLVEDEDVSRFYVSDFFDPSICQP